MKRLAVLLSLVVAACSSSGNDTRTAYLDRARQYLPGRTDAALWQLGHSICRDAHRGASLPKLVVDVMHTGASAGQAGAEIGLSVHTFCTGMDRQLRVIVGH